jgi:hypothetical protein
MLIPVIKFIMAFVFGNYLLFGFQPAQARMSISKIYLPIFSGYCWDAYMAT